MKIKLGVILRKIVFAFGIIYGINIMLKNVGIYLPLNIFTISITTILGAPGLLSLFALLYLLA